VAAIEPGSGHRGDEELRAVGVATSVGHRKEACLRTHMHARRGKYTHETRRMRARMEYQARCAS
jgi:hypothetical protein